jgi:3-hydroxyisobutyrate dehydrogenase
MLDEAFETSFSVDGALKDAALIRAAAADAGVRMEIAEIAEGHLAEAAEAGLGDQDMAAIWKASRQV